MRPTSTSGFYLSRKTVVLCSFLVLVLLVVCTVLAIFYGKLIAENTGIFSPTWEPPSTDWETAAPGRQGPWNNSRLPNSLIARNYQLELWPRSLSGLERPSHFFGQVNVTVTCIKETEVILLHSHELRYTGVAIAALLSPAIRCTWFAVENDYLVIELNEKLITGMDYIIQANYSGKLDELLTGLFITNYTEWGVNKTVIASQMEPVYARSVFPCFDEPAMKATFDIRLVHRPQFVALSNMPAIYFSERLEKNGIWKVTTFNTSVKMSTYLVAFVISDFGCVNTTSNGVEIRVWADKQAISKGEAQYAINVLGPILSFFEEYFNVSYPLSKLDVVALPEFEWSAMENWGLLTFRKDMLLHHPNEFIEDMLETSLVIAHELAHQWFGNLVTMHWWNDLWLNEGLARYFEIIGASVVFPSAANENIIFTEEFYNLRPVAEKERYIRTPDEIRLMFSSVTYNKGANVIAIASRIMTKELLAKGLRSYLKTFSYSNTVTDDMWNHLQMAIDSQDAIKLPASVKSILDTWAKQEGFPLITVNTTSGIITQEESFDKEFENIMLNNSWFIPVYWTKNGSKQPVIWLEEKYKTIPEVKCTTDEEWVLLNINISAFYRVNYDDSNWHRLILQLNNDPSVIPVINRAQMISDAFHLARVGHVDVEIALEMTVYLAKEKEKLVWRSAMVHLKHIEVMLTTTSSYGLYKKFFFDRVVPFYHYQMSLINHDFNNMNNDDINISLFVLTIETVCRLNLKDCLDRATSLFSQFMSNPAVNTIPHRLREVIYCGAIKAGTIIEWDFAFSIYQMHTSISDDLNLLSAMACTTDPWMLTRYLHYTIDKSKISKGHSWRVFEHVAKYPIGWILAWNFIRANWKLYQSPLSYF
ncbi:aminopeptidase Q-like isoform X2 [Amblyraja radiata]|uniref:aminopeptidase Q-like isoform X2 n=1 Tax=Amblyraja radiata TaxID=386614 RepID=UPI0014031AFB|nr:aminopeptidase Q-like isoform X2 [Amblyraja radiata]